MSDFLSILGLLISILGVVITVSIFCIQNHQNKNEKKIQELLKLQNELSKCEMRCKELGEYDWYQEMIFSETKKELDYAITKLTEKIRSFKNEKYIYISRYDSETMKRIEEFIEGIEIGLRELVEDADLQNAFIEHNFGLGDPHDESFWDEYAMHCHIIKNMLGAFRAFAFREKVNREYVEKELERMNYRTNIIELQFGELDEKLIQQEIDKNKEQWRDI